MARFVEFPGEADSYVATDDVNLLDADSAHLQQGVGQWSVGALSTTHVLFGDNSLKVTGGVDTVLTPGTDAAIMSCWVYSVAGADFDINGSVAVTVAAATWTQLSEVGPDITYTVVCSTAADYWVDKACVRAGSDPTFVPSLRIVGTLFESFNATPDDPPIVFAADGTPLTVGAGWAGDLYGYSRHDGADTSAPVVARFDPDDIDI